MQAKLRRVLSVLAVLAMLCTLLPLSAISVAAEASENLIVNGDFESGSVGSLPSGWTAYQEPAHTSTAQAHGGAQGAALAWRNCRHVLRQDVTVTPNTEYTVTAWYKFTGQSANGRDVDYTLGAYVTGSDSKGNQKGGGTRIDLTVDDAIMSHENTEWTQVTYTFNSGSYTQVRIAFTGNDANATQPASNAFAFVDDVVMTANSTQPEQPDDGGDEGGEDNNELLHYWNFDDKSINFSGASIVAEGPDGSNCMKWSAAGNYSLSYIAINGFEKDTEYVITFKAKANVAKPMYVTIQDGSWDNNKYYNETFQPTTEWAEYTITTNVGDTPDANGGILFKFQDCNVAMDIWVDDLSIAKVIKPEDDGNMVINGGFEDGNNSWTLKTGASIVSGGRDGGSALQMTNPTNEYPETAVQYVNVKPGYTYTINWWSKRVSGDCVFNLYLTNKASNTDKFTTTGYNWMSSSSTEWIQHSMTFTVNENTRILMMKFSAQAPGTGTILIDDVQLFEHKQASFDGWLYNGDFEVGTSEKWTVYHGTNVSTDAAKTGKYGLELKGNMTSAGIAYQDVPTEAGKNYLVSMWVKALSSGVNIKAMDATNSQKLDSAWINKTAWTYVELEFTATSNSTRINFSGANNGVLEHLYLDDVRMLEVKEPSFDGYIYNGDFEAGTLVKWESYQQTALSPDASHTGKYGAHIYGNAQWGSLLDQSFTVEFGKTYKISFWYYGLSNGINFSIKNGDNKLITDYLSFKYSTGWKLFEGTFEAGYATNLLLTFSGSGLATTTAGVGTHDECYIDDIKIENLSGDQIDRNPLTTNGGTSIRDVDDNNRGLAFKFDLLADGIQVKNGNEYVSGTGSVDLFKYNDEIGTLVKFGAVVTNDASIGTGDFTLADVNGKKVIDVPAKYLLDLEDDAASYAVRIINIPDSGVGTTIYARPYYTYELNGEQVTVYGTIENDSYDHVANIRRSLKILAIGNSFSVDAMKNHLYDVLKSADYDQVILGNLYIGGCSLDTHWNNINGGLSAYQYQKNDNNGEWVYTENTTALSALQDETWDIITVQQASPDSGRGNTYGNLQNIVNWVNDNKTNSNAKVYWHMTWAYQQNSTHEGFANYGNNQMTMYNAIVDAVQNNVLTVNGINGIIPSGTAIQNLRTSGLGDTLTADGYHLKDTYGDYTAALTWFRALTGESLDLVTYWPNTVVDYKADIMQATARAVYAPYEVSDLGETIILGLSDFQASTDELGADQVQQILSGGIAQKYGMFDGLFAVGDYSAAVGYDVALTGIQALDKTIDPYVSGNKIYTEGNHDAPDLPGLSPTGNNDPAGGKYGIFVINEEDYDQFGEGGEAAAAMMQAYFNEKLADPTWGNKPIFVLCHVPLHYSMRTETSNSGKTARTMVDVLNEAGANGLNILFLFGHNHSGGYDDFLGAGSVYLKKGDQMIVPQYGANYKYNWDTVTLNFTYMNVGYVGYNADNGYGADVALTVTTYRIQSNGDVIITRWDKNGEHNLKSAGVKNTVLMDTFDPDLTVYESSRVVTATDDRKYEGE